MTVVLVVSFLLLWAGAAVLLSCLPWFQRPLKQGDWVQAVETWVGRQ